MIEDSYIGVMFVKVVGMVCIVIKSGYIENEDFSEVDVVFFCIGDLFF